MCNALNHPVGCNCGFGGTSYVQKNRNYQQSLRFKKNPDTQYWFNDIHRDQVTFPTSCYWCREDVYFHRNSNGGCVLFDELGHPWMVHICWEKYKSARSNAERELCSKFKEISLNSNPQTKKYFDGVKTVSGCLYKVGEKFNLVNHKFSIIEFFIKDENRNVHRVVIQKEFFDEIKWYSKITITGSYGVVCGKNCLMPLNLSAETPHRKMFFIPPKINI